MQIRIPKSDKYEWTRHAMYKMQQYGLSPQRVIRVIRNPQRVEEGIVEKTVAVMQPSSTKIKNGKKIWSQEIWTMYQIKCKNQKSKIKITNQNAKLEKIPNTRYKILNTANRRIRIISAWRYPGVSPKNSPIPEEILMEIGGII